MSGMLAIYLRELLILRKRLFRQLASMSVSPLLYLVAFGFGMGRGLKVGSRSYLEFLVPGLVAMTSMIQAFAIGSEINIARFYWHIFEEFQAAPIRNISYVSGEVLAGVTRALFSVVLILLIAALSGVTLSYNLYFWIAAGLNELCFRFSCRRPGNARQIAFRPGASFQFFYHSDGLSWRDLFSRSRNAGVGAADPRFSASNPCIQSDQSGCFWRKAPVNVFYRVGLARDGFLYFCFPLGQTIDGVIVAMEGSYPPICAQDLSEGISSITFRETIPASSERRAPPGRQGEAVRVDSPRRAPPDGLAPRQYGAHGARPRPQHQRHRHGAAPPGRAQLRGYCLTWAAKH